jgi:hypothetical protein
MKNLLLLSCSLGFFLGNAQNIFFTDNLLKGALINDSLVGYSTSFIDLNGNILESVDTNNDGEISISEAQNIEHIDFYYLPFTNVEGLQFFTNVKSIYSLNSILTSFSLPELVNLEKLTLEAASGQQTLTSFDVSGNLNLKILELNTASASTIDLSNNITLRELRISSGSTITNLNLDNLGNLRKFSYYGNLSTLDLSDCIKLIEISIGFSTAQDIQLSAIDLSNQPLLANLYISNTQITSLDLSNNVNLDYVYVPGNLLQSINFGGISYVRTLYCENNQLTSLNLNNFQNLDLLSCANNNLIELKIKNFAFEDYIDFSGNPNLAYVCCDAEQEVYIQNQALSYGNFDAVVDSSCESNGILGVGLTNTVDNTITIFPNPTKNYLTVSATAAIENVEIYDYNGRLIRTFKNVSEKIDVTNMQAGMYFIKANSDEGFVTGKFIKE